MGFKAQAATVETVEAAPRVIPTQDIWLEIEGLIPNNDGTFQLKNVPIVDLDCPAVGAHLEKAGIDKRDAERYVDEFLQLIFERELAKLLAKRTRRVY